MVDFKNFIAAMMSETFGKELALRSHYIFCSGASKMQIIPLRGVFEDWIYHSPGLLKRSRRRREVSVPSHFPGSIGHGRDIFADLVP